MANGSGVLIGSSPVVPQRLPQGVTRLAIGANMFLNNITITGNTFQIGVLDVYELDVAIKPSGFLTATKYSIQLFNETLGVVVQEFQGQIDPVSSPPEQNFPFTFQVTNAAHFYSIRMNVQPQSGNQDNAMSLTAPVFYAVLSSLDSQGAGGVQTAIPPLFISGTTISLGQQPTNAVAPTTADPNSSVTWSPIDGAHKALVLQEVVAQSTDLFQAQSSTGVVYSAVPWTPGGAAPFSGTNNQIMGSGAVGALTSGSSNSIYGQGAAPTLATGSGSVIIGKGTDVNAATTSNAIIIGTGAGVVAGSSTSVIIKTAAVNSATTNDLIIESGDTGLRRQAANTFAPTNGAGGAGYSTWLGIPTVSQPPVSGANNGALYYDDTLQQLMVSYNGTAYVAIATGSGSFPVRSSAAGTPIILTSASATITGAGNTVAGGGGTLAATLTSGTNNVLIGTSVDVGAATASNAVAIGNTAVAPNGSTVIGNAAGKAGATGTDFTCIGNGAGTSITSGSDITLVGFQAGPALASNGSCTFVGSLSGTSVTGANNTLLGKSTATTLTTGGNNVVIGTGADLGAAAAANSVVIGATAVSPTGGTVIGNAAGKAGATATNFTCIGNGAGTGITSGGSNTIVGAASGKGLTTGSSCTFVGAGIAATITGGSNTLIGQAAASTLTTGASNVVIGTSADLGTGAAGNSVCIGSVAICPSGGVVIGSGAGAASATAARFTCIGNTAGAAITTGADNTFVGDSCAKLVTTSPQNTFVGSGAGVLLINDVTGANTGVGYQSLPKVTASTNTAVGQRSGFTLTSGTMNVFLGYQADILGATNGNCVVIGAESNAGSSGITIGSSITGVAAGSQLLISTASKASATANDLYIASGDTGINRLAAGVVQPNLGNATTTAGWLSTAGHVSLVANFTNATATFSNTNLSVTLIAGRTYSFVAAFFVSNSTTTEGVKIDFNGGTATATNFIGQAVISDGTAIDASTRLTALNSVANAATLTNSSVIYVFGTITVNAAGTFIVRAAENTTATGTLTMSRGSYMNVWDTPAV